MTIEGLRAWAEANPAQAPWVFAGLAVVLNGVVFFVARNLLARGLIYLTRRSESKVDDVLVENMRPYRFAWIAPLLLMFYLAGWFPEVADFLRDLTLMGVLWLTVVTLMGLLTAVNIIYEAGESYRGLSIQGYLDLGKILTVTIGVILTVSQITGRSPAALLSGLGAIMAVLVLIFRDTLLSLVASLQIQSQDLVREGDWIEMPTYEADGDIVNMALHTVTVRNWDKTISVIPTYKLLDTPYRNWRGMTESGGRRIKRALYIDLNSVRFCDDEMIKQFGNIGFVKEYVERHLDGLQ
ncbi:MAG: mechanosensitive ion channel family protein, partial [Anaerolineae bacterium]|nr:mechanosensitive ion channel family protein [Anaerolineae bacterium]